VRHRLLTNLAVEVSYDGGVTWRPAASTRDGDKAFITLQDPRNASHVSPRATATDSDGNKVEQTIIGRIGSASGPGSGKVVAVSGLDIPQL
jgi:hypothetical protein